MKDSVNRIINVGKKCLYSGPKVIISSIFITKRFKHTRIDYNNYVVSHEKIIGKNSDVLRIPRVKNLNRLIMGNLNTNSISNKFDQLKLFALGSYSYFYRNQIGINVSYFPVYDRWLWRTISFWQKHKWGWSSYFIREDIPSKLMRICYHMTMREFLLI